MKKLLAFSMALYITFFSVLSCSFTSLADAPSYTWLGYEALFEELYHDGQFDWSAYSDSVKSQLIGLVCDVIFAPSLVSYFTSSLDFLLTSYEGYDDINDFFNQVLSFDSSDDTIDISGEGRRIVRNACTRTMNLHSDYLLIKSLPISSNLIYFSNSSSVNSSNLSYVIDFLNDYSNDYYIFCKSVSASSSSTYVSFLDTSSFLLFPKNSVGVYTLPSSTSSSYNVYKFNDGSQDIIFKRGTIRIMTSESSSYGNYYSVGLSAILDSYVNGTTLTLTSHAQSGSYQDYYSFPFNDMYGVLPLPKGFNNNNFPFIDSYSSNYYYWNFITLDDVEVMTVYSSYNSYLATLTEVPSYFVGDTYYSYDYSSNNSTTIGSQTIYDNCPNYNTVYNYYGDYFVSNGAMPNQTIVYEYINNYYYDSSGGSGGGSGGDSGGSGGSGGGIFDWLGSLGSVLGSLISGFGNLIVNLLDSVVDVFGNLATVLPESMGTFFSTFFEWLPPEWVSLITLSLTLGIVFGLVRLVRG